ncbi:hypothetical protein MXB_847 [Myxobolus squamalis]|nr:hypothetical protein MXB_847 [Myxobolus squamalis]
MRKNHIIIKKKNFYEIIGVPRDASFLKQLNDAYTVIRNAELRKKYDLDLQVSGDMSDYLKNILRDVQFKRSMDENSRSINKE